MEPRKFLELPQFSILKSEPNGALVLLWEPPPKGEGFLARIGLSSRGIQNKPTMAIWVNSGKEILSIPIWTVGDLLL